MVSTEVQTDGLASSLVVDGHALRRLRLMRGRSQTQAAQASDGHPLANGRPMARNHWSRIERAGKTRVRVGTAYKLAIGVAAQGAKDAEITAVLRQFATVE